MISVNSGALHLAEFAEAGLDCGLVREDDWDGDLASSLKDVLAQRFRDLVRMWDGPLGHIELAINTDWASHEPRPEEVGFAYFAVTDGYSELFAERATMLLESFVPGLGFAVLETVFSVLSRIGTDTWQECEAWLDGATNEEEFSEEEYTDDNGETHTERLDAFGRTVETIYLPKINEFRELVPVLSLPRTVDPQLFASALAVDAPDPWMPEIVRLAWDLHGVKTKAPQFTDHSADVQDGSPVISVVVRWNESDRIAEVVDDYHEYLSQMGAYDILFGVKFAAGSDIQSGMIRDCVTAASAARQIQFFMEALPLCNQILAIINEQSSGSTNNNGAARPLSEIFGDES